VVSLVMKTPTLRSAKKKAWAEFSAYIRRRDCLKTTGTLDEGICITCGNKIPFKGSNAGHFISSRCNSVLFDEELTNLQCYSCNVGLMGNYVPYTLTMINRHGVEWVEEKQRLKHKILKRTINDYQTLEAIYKQKFINLKTEHVNNNPKH